MPYLTLAIVLLVFGIVLYLIFRRRPEKPLPPIDDEWRTLLQKNVVYYRNLNAAEQQHFKERMQLFFQQVTVTGIETEITILDKVLIAASGIIPTFGFPHWNQYPHLNEVLLYKDHFRFGDFATEGEDRRVAGMVGGGFLNGKLLLSRPSLHQGFLQNGTGNTGIHEFVHLLDKADGETNGVPAYYLENGYIIPWMEMIRKEAAAIERGRSDIDSYALTNKAEFFAVTAEYFFNKPAVFAEKYPELFALLETVFKQDMDEDGGIGTVDGEQVIKPQKG
ncbi:MAG: Mlc titration factor MtfA (ptsG expression regulator) [Neolewinella sp.]|jgi:Mlc titration factor MtfA (ptsG expression regulator)